MGWFDRFFGRRRADKAGEFHTLLERSMEELRLKTAAHDGAWHLSQADWAVDQTDGLIRFTLPKGMTATAPVQIVGTYNTEDGSWLWAWDHPSVHPPLQQHARILLDYGQRLGIVELTTRKLACTTDRAWEFCALACHLAGAQGAYRGPAGSALVFMTFGEVSLKKAGGDNDNSSKPYRPISGLKQVDAPEVLHFLEDFFRLNFEVEKAFNEVPKEGSFSAVIRPWIAKKKEIYNRFWRCSHDEFVPRSIGWPSDYDLSRTKAWRVFQLDDETYRIAFVIERLPYAYDVKRFDDGLKIVNYILD